MATLVQVEKFGPADKLASATTDSFTLSNAANLASSFSVLTYTLNNTPSGRPDYGLIASELSGTTTVDISRITAQSTAVSCCGYVAEYSAGVIVERGSTSLASSASVDVTLTTITDITKAFRIVELKASGSTVWGGQHTINSYLWMDGSTPKLRLELNATIASATAYWQVVQMDNCSVQRGSTSMTSAQTTPASAPTITAVDRTKSFLIFDYKHPNPAVANNVGSIALDGYFGSDTTLIFERKQHGSVAITRIDWEVVSFANGVAVEEVRHTFAAAANTTNKTITEVTAVANTLVIGANRCHWGSTTATTDTMGECAFQFNLTTTTNLTVLRQSNQDAFEASVTCYVLDLGVVVSGSNSTGTAAQTLSFLTQAASGTFNTLHTGTATQTLPFLTQAASGINEPEFEGTAAQTLSFLTQAASGSFEPESVGDIAQELSFLTQAAEGISEAEFVGTIEQTLSFLTQAATGSSHSNHTGEIVQTLSFLTQSSSGLFEPESEGPIVQTLSLLTQTMNGTFELEFEGAAEQTLSFLTQAASGTYTIPGGVGDIVQEIPFLTQDLNGTHEAEFEGTAIQTLSFFTQDADGYFIALTSGTVEQTLPFFTQEAEGTHEPEFTGEAAQTLPFLTQESQGDTEVPLQNGAITQFLSGLSQTMAGTFEPEPLTGAVLQEAEETTQSIDLDLIVQGAVIQEANPVTQQALLGLGVTGVIVQETSGSNQESGLTLSHSGVINQTVDDIVQIASATLSLEGAIIQETGNQEQEVSILLVAAPVSGVINQQTKEAVNRARLVIQIIPVGEGTDVEVFSPYFGETQVISIDDSTGGDAIEIGQGEKVFLENTGLARCYFKIGDSSISAAAPTLATPGDVPLTPDIPIVVDSYFTNNTTKRKYVAAVCATGETTTLQVFTAKT